MYSRKYLILCFRSYIQNPESDTPPHAYGFLSRHKQKTERPRDQETRMMRYVSNTPPPAVGAGQGGGGNTNMPLLCQSHQETAYTRHSRCD